MFNGITDADLTTEILLAWREERLPAEVEAILLRKWNSRRINMTKEEKIARYSKLNQEVVPGNCVAK